MDPYETTGRHRPDFGGHFRKRSWIQRLLARIGYKKSPPESAIPNAYINPKSIRLGFMSINPLRANSPDLRIFPLDTPPDDQDTLDSDWIPVTVTVLNEVPTSARTVQDMKRNSRILRHHRQASRSWRWARR